MGAGASTLAGVYKNLTGDTGDPFPLFKQLLDDAFPSETSSAVLGPNFDDPWPLPAVLTHTIRFSNGSWQNFFGDVQAAVGQNIGINFGTKVSCSADQSGNLQVCVALGRAC